MKKVILSHSFIEEPMERLNNSFEKVRVIHSAEPTDMLSELSDADGVIIRIGKVDKETMLKCKNLKVIGRPGVGVDSIDVEAATELGIPVVITPGANARSVAEHAMTFLTQSENIGKAGSKVELCKVEGDQSLSYKEFMKHMKTTIKGSFIGTYVGAIPGIGGGVASFVSYNEAIRASKHPETFGKGELDGVTASEAANNGATGATLIPLLTLGIPGDVVTAVLLGAFMIQGLTPGPLLFKEHGATVYAIFAGLIIINIIMLIIGVKESA